MSDLDRHKFGASIRRHQVDLSMLRHISASARQRLIWSSLTNLPEYLRSYAQRRDFDQYKPQFHRQHSREDRQLLLMESSYQHQFSVLGGSWHVSILARDDDSRHHEHIRRLSLPVPHASYIQNSFARSLNPAASSSHWATISPGGIPDFRPRRRVLLPERRSIA